MDFPKAFAEQYFDEQIAAKKACPGNLIYDQKFLVPLNISDL